ncbi:MAG: pimeloyl-ACP methyl ester esterase BioH [Pseudomonadota bacterium]|nr:pimeloyl-ACP methyl ester esterase BioH [Pseudomonadota bacterium]
MTPCKDPQGGGPELVLLHGWGMNAAVWETLAPAFGDVRRQSRIELPGHGASPFEQGHDNLAAWAQACLEAAPEQAVWVGWSLGGLVALQAALQAPERIAALILVTATPRFVRASDWSTAVPAQTLEQFHTSLVADPAPALERFLALQVRGSDEARTTLRALRREIARRPSPDPSALALGLDLLREEDLRGRLAEVTCPTLWLFGERDTLVPAAAAEGVASLLPQARLRVIPGAAHAPFLSHPQETTAEIAEFLAGFPC